MIIANGMHQSIIDLSLVLADPSLRDGVYRLEIISAPSERVWEAGPGEMSIPFSDFGE